MSARKTPPRALEPRDRTRILNEANLWAASGNFLGLRTRAMLLLALSGALRTKELLALELGQVLELPKEGRWQVRSSGYLRGPQSKGRRRGDGQWDSSGQFVIAEAARIAIRQYVTHARKGGWLELEPEQPLFICNKNSRKRSSGPRRINRRTAQKAWEQLQRRAGVPVFYGLHCLRHEAITRFAHKSKDPHAVAAYARFTLATAMRYVHHNPLAIAEIAESVN